VQQQTQQFWLIPPDIDCQKVWWCSPHRWRYQPMSFTTACMNCSRFCSCRKPPGSIRNNRAQQAFGNRMKRKELKIGRFRSAPQSALGAGGRAFKSPRPDQLIYLQSPCVACPAPPWRDVGSSPNTTPIMKHNGTSQIDSIQ